VSKKVEDDVVGVAEEEQAEQAVLRGGQRDGDESEAADGEGQAKRDELVLQVGAVPAGAPDLVERDFEGHEDPGRGYEEHHDGSELHAAMGAGEDVHVADDEVLSGGEEVADLVGDDGDHGRGVEGLAGQGEHEDDEGKERKDDICGNAEGVSVDLSLRKIEGQRLRLLGERGVFRQAAQRFGGGPALLRGSRGNAWGKQRQHGHAVRIVAILRRKSTAHNG
jgi:hypothetical protein